MSSLKYSKIVIPISAEIKGHYDIYPENTSLFEGDNLRLFGSYVPEYTFGSHEITKGFTGYEIKNNENDYSFNLTIEDSRIAIKYILDELIQSVKGDLYNYDLITVYDYQNVEFADRNTGYTIRYCTFDYNLKGGTFRNGLSTNSGTYTEGLSIKFTQLG
jgi:hypothetical protein